MNVKHDIRWHGWRIDRRQFATRQSGCRGDRTYRPDELVRVEIRMPATVAAQLFARARDHHQPVSRTASDLLAKALDHGGGRMG